MTDWTFYVRRFPWAAVAVAAAAGYMLIPRKKAGHFSRPEALAEMVQKKQLRLDVDHKSEKPSMMKSLLMMGITWAVKSGMAYMGERMQRRRCQQATQRDSRSTAGPVAASMNLGHTKTRVRHARQPCESTGTPLAADAGSRRRHAERGTIAAGM